MKDITGEVLREIETTLEHPKFYSRVFAQLTKIRKELSKTGISSVERICKEEYLHLTKRLDRTELQESCSVRNVLRSRQIARLLLDGKGQLDLKVLSEMIQMMRDNLYSLGPDRQYDGPRHEHLLKAMVALQEQKELQILLQRMSRPVGNPNADQMIRDTLQIPKKTPLTDYHVRWAALSAWFCYLRQSVGSCFATAPAILVQAEQPKQFLTDLHDLLSTGQLKRTFGGVEYAVPFSSSWGAGDLKRQFLLHRNPKDNAIKIWESPGLLIALTTHNILDKKLGAIEKKKEAERLVFEAIEGFKEEQNPFVISIEEILKRILMKHHEITEEDLYDYQNRPQMMMPSGLAVAASTKGGKGAGAHCANYLEDYEKVKKSFLTLADNALLKAWEFTVASFAETKADFTKWNLYSSLGLGTDQPNGIGQKIYTTLAGKMEEYNREVQKHQEEYEILYPQLKYLEAKLSKASSEKEAQWIKMDYQAKRNEFRTLEEMRDRANRKAKGIAHMYETLLELLYQFFPKYFQEVYDPDMHEVSVGPYDDSPAGFRLLCKYGRAASAAWTPIDNVQQFVDGLSSFFVAAEHEMAQDPRIEGLEEDLSEVITNVVIHVKTREFMESAFDRMAIAHRTRPIKNPLDNLDKVEKKPWAYTSGGTMNGLMSCYFSREENPTEVDRWMESESELLVFLLDIIKKMPPKDQEIFDENPNKFLLIHSPTHAFLLKPGLETFKSGWQNESYTYIWVRDTYLRSATHFVKQIVLKREMIEYLVHKLLSSLPKEIREKLEMKMQSLPKILSPKEFKEYYLDIASSFRGLGLVERGMVSPDFVDHLLYLHLPFSPAYHLEKNLKALFQAMPSISSKDEKALMKLYEKALPSVLGLESISAHQLQEMAKGLIVLHFGKTSLPFDVHLELSRAAQSLELALPAPMIFSDTNWVKDLFALVVNPGNGEFELWRMDYTGRVGYPMRMWKQWLNGTRKDRTWGVYPKYYEYTSADIKPHI